MSVATLAAEIEPHIPALRRYAYALLHQDAAADDLVQDCLERAVAHWTQRRTDGPLRPWLFAILRNQFLTQTKVASRIALEPLPDDGDIGDPVEPSTSGDDIRDILSGLATLPEEQKSVLLLVGVEDMSYGEAARILGIPIGTVMSRLSRGRERLRRFLDGEHWPRRVS